MQTSFILNKHKLIIVTTRTSKMSSFKEHNNKYQVGFFSFFLTLISRVKQVSIRMIFFWYKKVSNCLEQCLYINYAKIH